MNTDCPIQRAVFSVGGQSALARKLGVKPQAVQRWCATGTVPSNRVLDVERVTDGQVTRNELRPDLYPLDRAAASKGGGMNYYEHHIGDYIKATAHLSMLEDAAYRRLIDAYYTKGSPLPADCKTCYRLARATSKPERDAVDTILHEFFILEEDGWHNSRCDAEIANFVKQRGM